MGKIKLGDVNPDLAKKSKDEADVRSLDSLAKSLRPLLVGPVRVSVSKLSKDVTALSNLINEKDKQLNNKMNNIELKYKDKVNLGNIHKLSGLEDELASVELNLNNRLNILALSVEAVKKQESHVKVVEREVVEPLVVNPEVKEITINKNHDVELKELSNEIKDLEDRVIKVESNKDRVVEVRHSSKAQNRFNIILVIGLAVSIALHVI